MFRYFVEFSYNGTRYNGWQMQNNAHTVQAEINKALELLCGQGIDTVGAGRTDTGVHAKQMFLHVDLADPIPNPDQLVFKLNKLLPFDIAVQNIFRVAETAHARFDAISRTYEYHITQIKNPFLNNAAYYLWGNLNVDAMNNACNVLFNYKDFKCFSKTHTDVKTTLCDIYKAEWKISGEGNKLVFTISANRFLRNMVRAIVGTMLEVGKNKIDIGQFKKIIESGDRGEAGQSVPAHALYLTEVKYPKDIFLIK